MNQELPSCKWQAGAIDRDCPEPISHRAMYLFCYGVDDWQRYGEHEYEKIWQQRMKRWHLEIPPPVANVGAQKAIQQQERDQRIPEKEHEEIELLDQLGLAGKKPYYAFSKQLS